MASKRRLIEEVRDPLFGLSVELKIMEQLTNSSIAGDIPLAKKIELRWAIESAQEYVGRIEAQLQKEARKWPA